MCRFAKHCSVHAAVHFFLHPRYLSHPTFPLRASFRLLEKHKKNEIFCRTKKASVSLRNNKNRLCSRTCGIDKTTKIKKIAKKDYSKDCKPWMDPTPKRNLIFLVTDPTPKRYLVKEPRIPPQRKFRVGEQESKRSGSWSLNCSPPPTTTTTRTTTTTLTVLRPDGFAAGNKETFFAQYRHERVIHSCLFPLSFAVSDKCFKCISFPQKEQSTYSVHQKKLKKTFDSLPMLHTQIQATKSKYTGSSLSNEVELTYCVYYMCRRYK